jgi:hypothetical protein
MPVSQKKIAVSKFPLRLMPSVRRVAGNFSRKEGVSLGRVRPTTLLTRHR